MKLAVFDAYGTLLDVDAAARQLAASGRFPDLAENWPALAALWRSRQLQYSWLRALTGHYVSFWQITEDGLDFALESLSLSDPALRDALLGLYRRLTPYDDALPALERARAAGYQTAILSNADSAMLADAATSAGLDAHLDVLLSVDQAGIFKPDPSVYQLVCDHFNCRADEVRFFSSNGWDIAGAGRFGFQTHWVNRAGQPIERLGLTPDQIIPSLGEAIFAA
ncbi:MAG: haloacid dehalogenase type II [Candidatus Puniceispirillaceae bacterium]